MSDSNSSQHLVLARKNGINDIGVANNFVFTSLYPIFGLGRLPN